MKAGEIYDLYFPFKPPIKPGEAAGKTRPALILSISTDGTTTAILVKITGSKPSSSFPNRIQIVHWRAAGLEKQSYAEINSSLPFDFSTVPHTYRGELQESDFNRVLSSYLKLRTGGSQTTS
ncbi:type II toxin-antitoxin system PemK/MazF family toxin [Bacillus sp. DTU_2020_1000418_1_SI_GHA_SEK_038]|uniref:type II toxin-antitoxin system PemK/MazF family toxin n=1 Tax=Bacillus sp. DTU_2020_1000418_1_SI_GHA_SEK_038 TaxID=3077585 RepID=UPI0028ED9A15|nr:type II toxin-antitoxin system PemK/MazF family toxin [Bacillus sp. DTU_2020_1000418_1_SI_GHA_SEK_038]WNS75181.1 type II toxin-antitoxin system PemK/MazF family toxin [Bacillus sp. DTU_2020_1000418_1_SI_GHA_SEK_038]